MWIILIITWFICAGFSAYIAGQKNRSVGNWFLVGLLFGIFALIAISAVPTLLETGPNNNMTRSGGIQYWKCKNCEQINGLAVNICSKCGARHL